MDAQRLHLLSLTFLSLLYLAKSFVPKNNLFINCGSNANGSLCNRVFISDSVKPSLVSLSVERSVSLTDRNPSPSSPILYRMTRVFTSESSYEFDVKQNWNGTNLVRLHFSSFIARNFNMASTKFEVLANHFLLLHGFSAYNTVLKEFLLRIDDLSTHSKINAILNGAEIMKLVNPIVMLMFKCKKKKSKLPRRVESVGWTLLRVYGGSSYSRMFEGTTILSPGPNSRITQLSETKENGEGGKSGFILLKAQESARASSLSPLLIFPSSSDVDSLCALKIIFHILESDSVWYSCYPVSSFQEIREYAASELSSSSEEPVTMLLINWGCRRDLQEDLKLGVVVLYTNDDERLGDLAYDFEVMELANASYSLHSEGDEDSESEDEDEEEEAEERAREGSRKRRRMSSEGEEEPASRRFKKLNRDYYRMWNFPWQAIRVFDYINSLGTVDAVISVTLKDGTKVRAPDSSRIAYEEEPRLMLLREWNLFDSMLCSSYIAPKLKTWSDNGMKKLKLLARMGFALVDCQQKFQVSAADMVYGVTALLESSMQSNGTCASKQLGLAYDALSLVELNPNRPQGNPSFSLISISAATVKKIPPRPHATNAGFPVINMHANRTREMGGKYIRYPVRTRETSSGFSMRLRAVSNANRGSRCKRAARFCRPHDRSLTSKEIRQQPQLETIGMHLGQQRQRADVIYQPIWAPRTLSVNDGITGEDEAVARERSRGSSLEGIQPKDGNDTILRQGSAAITKSGCIRIGRKFRWVKLEDSVDTKLLGQPQALTKFCYFLMDALKEKGAKLKPLLCACILQEPSKVLIVGACGKPRLGALKGNAFGLAFRNAAEETGAEFFHELFESSWIVLDPAAVNAFMADLEEVVSYSIEPVRPDTIDVEAIEDDAIESSATEFAEAKNNSRSSSRRTVDVDSASSVYEGRILQIQFIYRHEVKVFLFNFKQSTSLENGGSLFHSFIFQTLDYCLKLMYLTSLSFQGVRVQEIIKPQPPPQKPTFNCPICMGSFTEEMPTRCGHIFCNTCIKTALAERRKRRTCRKRVVVKELIRVFLPSAS
ncbi:RPM1-interacting protein 4-like [Hibiscus syriacus]|uniref:RPM1-interacting protein 4-like n=1 Tax=Hibiscus syriacus TaxID=106335 RepID=A0A6A3AAD5_HIBSY|nr:RPM1-interacting protein 4-like [Hibiscus syriacus]